MSGYDRSLDAYYMCISYVPLHTCARGKVIGLSVCRRCPQKIGKSRDISVMASSKYCQTVRNIEKRLFFAPKC